nr:guanine deaminase-like [Tanacetum cinerariifolium]
MFYEKNKKIFKCLHPFYLNLLYEAAIAIGFDDFTTDALRGMDFIRKIIWRSKKADGRHSNNYARKRRRMGSIQT